MINVCANLWEIVEYLYHYTANHVEAYFMCVCTCMSWVEVGCEMNDVMCNVVTLLCDS